jgi:hypothetical protein
LGGSKYWLLVIEECTAMCWSWVLPTKSSLSSSTVLGLLKDLKEKNSIHVKYIRCDKAGETIKLHDTCTLPSFVYIHFEFTTLGTLQQNKKVKPKLTTLYALLGSTLNHAKVPERFGNVLWPRQHIV